MSCSLSVNNPCCMAIRVISESVIALLTGKVGIRLFKKVRDAYGMRTVQRS